MSNTLTKARIVQQIFDSIGLSKNESSDILDYVISQILESLKKGKSVKLANFGSFQIRSKNSRTGRNPKTMQEHEISARKVIIFRPSSFLIKKINKK